MTAVTTIQTRTGEATRLYGNNGSTTAFATGETLVTLLDAVSITTDESDPYGPRIEVEHSDGTKTVILIYRG